MWLQTTELQYGEDASPLQPLLSIKIRSFNTQNMIRSSRELGNEFWRGRSSSLNVNPRTLIGLILSNISEERQGLIYVHLDVVLLSCLTQWLKY